VPDGGGGVDFLMTLLIIGTVDPRSTHVGVDGTPPATAQQRGTLERSRLYNRAALAQLVAVRQPTIDR